MTCGYWGLQDQLRVRTWDTKMKRNFTETSMLGWSNTTVSTLRDRHFDAKKAVNEEKGITNLVAIEARKTQC